MRFRPHRRSPPPQMLADIAASWRAPRLRVNWSLVGLLALGVWYLGLSAVVIVLRVMTLLAAAHGCAR